MVDQYEMSAQRVLNAENISEFYHDNFVADQVRDFDALARADLTPGGVVADVGGGCGHFAGALTRDFGLAARVLDSDPVSVREARSRGVQAELFDALNPDFAGDEDVVCFNLILHHLVGGSLPETRAMQRRALAAWSDRRVKIFVNEYIYVSPVVRGASAWIIGVVTSSGALSAIARVVGRFVPSLRANTLGVGVRFRDDSDWRRLFAEAGFRVAGHRRGSDEPVSLARRLMLIAAVRRDSFLLVPSTGPKAA